MTQRNHSLDVLRGIAVLAVVVHHYFPPDMPTMFHRGGDGVYLFFVLSGYLICWLLFTEIRRTEDLRIGRFLLRRALKIYPAFYVFLLLTIPVVPPYARISLVPEFLFLQQYVPHVWEHTWSLSVEETFYICAPLLIALLYRVRAVKIFPLLTVAITVSFVVLRIMGLWPIRIEGLTLGSLIAYTEAFHEKGFRKVIGWWFLPLAFMLLIPSFFLHGEWKIFEVESLAFGCFVCLAAVHPNIVPQLNPIAAIGRYSYSIYLWHMPIALFAWIALPHSIWGEVLNVLLSLIVGVGMFKAVEMPVISLRDRIFPRASRQIRSCQLQASGKLIERPAPSNADTEHLCSPVS